MVHLVSLTCLLSVLLSAAAVADSDPFTGPEELEAPVQIQKTPEHAPLRERHVVFAAEGGWNGLAGMGGVNVLVHALPTLALDLGAGYAATGTKVGGRIRYKFLDGSFKPFVGAGYAYSLGLGSKEDIVRSGFAATTYRVLGSHTLAMTGGFEYVAPFGLDVLLSTGYSFLLNNNIQTVDRPLDENQRVALANTYGSGLVFSASVGFAF